MMSTRHALVFNFLTALALCHGPIVATAGVITFDETTGGSGVNNNQSVGWQFNVLSPITVLSLEWYDPSRTGLSTAHTVGVWSPIGDLLTSALIPAGAVGVLDDMFRGVQVSAISLPIGNGYIIGGENFANNSDRLACGGALLCDGSLVQFVDPRLSFVNATFSSIGSGFTRPTSFSVSHEGFYGPSFSTTQVPEPSSFGMLVIGIVVLGWFGVSMAPSGTVLRWYAHVRCKRQHA
jgi:hypothetical protein